MKLTADFLKSKDACIEGRAWFERHFGVEADYQTVLNLLVKNNLLHWAEWLMDAVGPVDDVMELTADTKIDGHLFAAGGGRGVGDEAVRDDMEVVEMTRKFRKKPVVMEMTWTKTRPTVIGWYWWRSAKGDREQVVEVVKDSRVLFALFQDDEKDNAVLSLDGKWAGPIPEPTEEARE